MLKRYKKDILEIFFIIIFIFFVRIFLFPLVGIADISAIITNSMEHSDNWKYSLYLSKNNIPCCFVAKNFSLNYIVYPINRIAIPVFRDKNLIDLLNNLSNTINCKLNDCIFYNQTYRNNQSFIIFEKKLKWALIYIKYPRNIPFNNGINRADVIIVKKINNPCKEIKNYDVIEYKLGNFNLVHRVVMKLYFNNTCVFIVKGDNSKYPIPNIETYLLPNQIVGKVIYRIPYLGIFHYIIFKLLGVENILKGYIENKINIG